MEFLQCGPHTAQKNKNDTEVTILAHKDPRRVEGDRADFSGRITACPNRPDEP